MQLGVLVQPRGDPPKRLDAPVLLWHLFLSWLSRCAARVQRAHGGGKWQQNRLSSTGFARDHNLATVRQEASDEATFMAHVLPS